MEEAWKFFKTSKGVHTDGVSLKHNYEPYFTFYPRREIEMQGKAKFNIISPCRP